MAETTLGQRIAQRRKGLGLSQEAFGEKLGVSTLKYLLPNKIPSSFIFIQFSELVPW